MDELLVLLPLQIAVHHAANVNLVTQEVVVVETANFQMSGCPVVILPLPLPPLKEIHVIEIMEVVIKMPVVKIIMEEQDAPVTRDIQEVDILAAEVVVVVALVAMKSKLKSIVLVKSLVVLVHEVCPKHRDYVTVIPAVVVFMTMTAIMGEPFSFVKKDFDLLDPEKAVYI